MSDFEERFREDLMELWREIPAITQTVKRIEGQVSEIDERQRTIESKLAKFSVSAGVGGAGLGGGAAILFKFLGGG